MRVEDNRSSSNSSSSVRHILSQLLSRSADVASGTYACGGKLAEDTNLPRIKLKHRQVGGNSLMLPLTTGEAERIKGALTTAGQEPDSNVDGIIEPRLPWAARPDVDFRVVNNAAWKAVVTRVLRKVHLLH